MKTLKQKIAVMQAALEGKEIEQLNLCIREEKWKPVETPLWDWVENDYRVKPEEPKPEYVPFESAEEFLQAQREHNLIAVHKGLGKHETLNTRTHLLVRCDGLIVVPRKGCFAELDFEDLCREYVWDDDGTPCGKLKK